MVDRQRQRSIDRYRDNVARIRAFIENMTPDRLDTLLQINEESSDPDGYPVGGSSGGSASTSDDTSTERAALRGLPGEPDPGEAALPDDWRRHGHPDPVGRQIDELLANLTEMAGLSVRAMRVLASIDHRPDLLKEREQPMSRCKACQRWVSGGDLPDSLIDDIDDPLDIVPGDLRSGYCSACNIAWVRAGRPDYPRRDAFERERADRHQRAKDARRSGPISDAVLGAMDSAQSKSVMPVRSAVSPGQHMGA